MGKIKAKKKIKIAKGATSGMGFLDWGRLEGRFRESGEITDQQELKTIYLAEEGLYYTTGKLKPNKSEK